jgi:hypothetical protein
VGHESGFLTIWEGVYMGPPFTLVAKVNLSNSHPVNPPLHNIRGVAYVTQDANYAYVITGSKDGNLTVVRVPDGKILGAILYNPKAKLGINSVSHSPQGLLVTNCAKGKSDKNLWYYSVDTSTWDITLVASTNLVCDTKLDQVFNFCAVWREYRNGPCWFASTEEGLLWMGTATSSSLDILGSEHVLKESLGAALGFTSIGKLVFVAQDLYQFLTK